MPIFVSITMTNDKCKPQALLDIEINSEDSGIKGLQALI